ISTAARVPQLMMMASCHHRLPRDIVSMVLTTSPLASKSDCFSDRSPMSSQLMKNEVEMHRMEAIQIRRVRGCSKSNSFFPLYFRSDMYWLMKYEAPDMKSIRKRIAKIQTMSLACNSRKLVVCVWGLNSE